MVVTSFLMLLVIGSFVSNGMFQSMETDGFYRQMHYLSTEGGSTLLHLVHTIRLFIVFPFYWLHLNDYSVVFQLILIGGAICSVVKLASEVNKSYFLLFLFALPLLLSFRAILVMVGFVYLYFYLYSSAKRSVLLIASFMLVNLSSGVVLAWVLVVLLNITRVIGRSVKAKVLVGCVIALFSFSILHKISFFLGDDLNSGESFWDRNTFYVSYVGGNYLRLVIYSMILILWMSVMCLCLLNYNSRVAKSYFLFFLPFLMLIPFEGLGMISYFIVLFFFFIGVRPYCSKY